MEKIITFKNFTKKFKTNQIGPINFDIDRGSITALLGGSGSGKTVVLNALTGIIKKYKGEILIEKINRKNRKSYLINKSIGYYTQMDFSLYDISAYNFLYDSCKIFGLAKNKIKEKIEYWLTFFELWDKKDKKLKNFSWGMKNRMNFIICFIKEPDIIILDEPGANLDSIWRNKIKNLLIKFKNEGKTIVVTVHNIDELAELFDDYIILESGEIIFKGSKKELDLYNKFKIFFSVKTDIKKFRDFMNSKKIKTFKYDPLENSIVFASNSAEDINWVFLFLLKESVPIKNLIKLSISMESIYKALEKNE